MAQTNGSATWVRGLVWLLVVAAVAGGLFLLVRANPRETSTESDVVAGLDPVVAEDWQRGTTDSSVVLIEYADLQCPACATYMPMLNELVSQYGDRVNFVYRHFPLPSHGNAVLSASVAEAAGRQSKFWEMLDELYSQQTAWSSMSDADARELFTNMAREVGLDEEQFASDLDAEEVRAAVETDRASGDRADVSGTPTFFLNGRKIENPRSVAEFAELLDAELAKAAPATVEPASSNDGE